MPGQAKPEFSAIIKTLKVAPRPVTYKKKSKIFTQGGSADAVYFLQSGSVRLSVVSRTGKEATLAILTENDFLGEECVASSQPKRLTTATAITECSMLRIDKLAMVNALHRERAIADVFVAYLLRRNARIQEDLIDQLFNSSEKRLARALLLLSNFGKTADPKSKIPHISQETLAEMVGTTRSRVNFFMNRFRKLGFIEYNGGIHVHNSLLNVILHD